MPRLPEQSVSPADAMLPAPGCRGLSADERFTVGAIREIVINGFDTPELDLAFARRCGAPGRAVVAAMGAWLLVLAENARRQIAVGYVTRCCPSPDEIMLLAIIEGCRRGDFAGAHAMLGELVHDGAVDALAHGAERLGEALLAVDICLRPVRFVDNKGADTPRR